MTLGGQRLQPCLHQLGAGTANPARHVLVNLSCLTVHLPPAAVTWPQSGWVTLVTVERTGKHLCHWSHRTGADLTSSRPTYAQGGAPAPVITHRGIYNTLFPHIYPIETLNSCQLMFRCQIWTRKSSSIKV